jgi:uncharacterized protein YidB (DUF937 family)
MGLFDSIAKQVLGGMSGGQDNITDSLGGLFNQVGGLDGLMQKAKSVGMEDKVASWVGTGENQPISGGQVEQLLGSDIVQGFASKLGFDVQKILPLLAQFLPGIVDKLTPNGRVEKGATNASDIDLSGVLASVMGGGGGGGGLGGLLGGLLGNGGKQG